MAYVKQVWENTPSENTPMSAERLNYMETGIYNNSQSIETINSNLPDIYSTSEVKTNKVWTDGKPIYRKVRAITFTDSSKQVALNIDNYSTMVSIRGFFKPPVLQTLFTTSLPYIYTDSETGEIEYINVRGITLDRTENVNYIRFDTNLDTLQGKIFYIIIEYTKTTTENTTTSESE